MGEMSGARFKGVTSTDDMLGYQSDSFKELLQLNSEGVSAFTMEQIKAKAATLGLTDSLTAQAVALGSDANFAAKAAAGSITWGQALKDSSVGAVELGDALLRSNNVSKDAKKALEDIASSTGKASDNFKTAVSGIIDGTAGFGDISDSFIDLGTTAEKSTGKLSNTFKGLLATAKQILPVIAAIGVAVAAFETFDYLTHGYTRAREEAETAASEYSTAATELQNLNSQYDQQQAKIEELQKLKTNGTITMQQEIELANLQSQNAELERQIELQESIVKVKQQASANSAIKAANTEQSYTEAMQEEYGTVLGWIMGLAGSGAITDPVTGQVTSAKQEWEESFNNDTTEQGLVEGYLDDLDELEKKLDEVREKRLDNPEDESLEQRQQAIENSIASTKEQISESASILQGWVDQCTDANGQITEGYESSVKSWRNTLNEINNIGKSQEEIDFNNLENFFTNNSYIESYLKSIVENGGSATDALKAFKEIGLDLDSLNISEDGFVRYFQDVKSSAEEAAEALNSVDGSFEGVQAAFESENQGSEWDAMSSNIASALKMMQEGRVGTDDFQTVSAWMSPTKINEDDFKYDSQAYVDAWQKAYDKIKGWFDSENPLDSMWDFSTDLESAGLANITKDANGALAEIIPTFSTTAEAAEKLGVGVNAVEAAMHKLEEFGFEFDDVMFSGEGLDRYESSLENIKTLYDSMSEGEIKDRLGGLIENWDSELEKYQDDMSLLTEDQIVHIEFEYDLATLQAQIDQINSLIEGGDASVENYAQVIAGNEQYIQTAEKGIGFDTDGVTIPVEYVANEDTIAVLKQQLSEATSEEDKVAIQAEITNLQELQKDLLNAFSDAHPEINAESSIDEVNAAWNDFVATTEGQEILAKIVADGDEAKQTVADILGIDPEDITVDIEANDNATPVIAKVDGYELLNKECTLLAQDDATGIIMLWNELVPTQKFASLTAEDRASYVIELWNMLTPDQKEAYLNGEITVVDNATGTVQTVNGELNALPLNPKANITASDNTSAAVSSANTSLNSIDNKTVNTYIITHRRTVGDSELSGTAHARGTAQNAEFKFEIPQLSGRALAMGTLQDESWLNPNWRTKHSEMALTGEEGPELVVTRANRWFTVGDHGAEFANIPLGSIVFNAKQTKELLSKGRINSRGSAMIGGTAFATGGYLPVPGSSGYGYGTSGTTASSSSSNASTKATQANTKAVEDNTKKTENLKDWIDTLVTTIKFYLWLYIERYIENLSFCWKTLRALYTTT